MKKSNPDARSIGDLLKKLHASYSGGEKKAPKTYNWDSGYAPANARLAILSALEEQVQVLDM